MTRPRDDYAKRSIRHLEVMFCPFCGERGHPLMGMEGEHDIKMLFECDEHGEFEVEVHAT